MPVVATNYEYKFFRVTECPHVWRRGLPEYSVINNKSSKQIGVIYWYHPWRQFVFYPEIDTVWSDDCLTNIKDAIKKISVRHKKGGQ